MNSESQHPGVSHGWLFGLEGPGETLTHGNLVIREMRTEEQHFILQQVQQFLYRDENTWINHFRRFPYIFEILALKSVGYEPYSLCLSLLTPGEIRCPVQWHLAGTSQASSSTSEITDYMFRRWNGRYRTARLQDHVAAIRTALPKLDSFIASAQLFQILDRVLVDRLYAAKRHVVGEYADPAAIIGRAADTCSCLEYLFNEGSTSEVQFRLAMSLAWLLELQPEGRQGVLSSVAKAYNLRSKHVHGARWGREGLRIADKTSVDEIDVLLRRALLGRAISGLNDAAWIEKTKAARIGTTLADFDRVEWLLA